MVNAAVDGDADVAMDEDRGSSARFRVYFLGGSQATGWR